MFTIFLLGTMVFETKAQTNNMPDRNWSQWSEWNSFECAKKLFFRIRYWEASKELYNWQVEFRNDYSEDLYFKYGLEESYKTHTIYGAESVQPIKANSTYISDNHHYVWQTKTNKFNEVDVYIFHVCMGRSNWDQTYPKYYSECTVNNESKINNGYFNYKWKCKIKHECYIKNVNYPNGTTDTRITYNEIVLNDVKFIDDCIIWEVFYGYYDTLCMRNKNYFVKEKQYSIANMNSYKKYEILIESENSFLFRNTDHLIQPQNISKCTIEYFYSREILKEDSTQSNDAKIIVGKHNVDNYNNVSSDLYNEFIDERDGQNYKTIKIGNQEWMAENLNYSTGNSWCYDNSSSNCNKYGRLYDWETAKKACPSGWHLPSESEFETLLSNVGGEGEDAYKALKDGGNSGFSALFAGWRYHDGDFGKVGSDSGWWSSSGSDKYDAWYLFMDSYYQDAAKSDIGTKEWGYSVRCLKDRN